MQILSRAFITLLILCAACGKVDTANEHLSSMNQNTDQMKQQMEVMNQQMLQLNQQIQQMNQQILSMNRSFEALTASVNAFVTMSQTFAVTYLQSILSGGEPAQEENLPDINQVLQDLNSRPHPQNQSQEPSQHEIPQP